MDFMYETSPTSTVLGYWAHQLPHAWHVGEIVFTFAAELLAPVLAVFAGRRGRWIAFWLWTGLQIGIQLTGNFGWINVGAIGLGLMLLDDQMLISAAMRLRSLRLADWLTARTVRHSLPPLPGWRLYGVRVVLWLHFGVTLFFFAKVCRVPVEAAPAVIAKPISWVADFRSANRYYLFEHVAPTHLQVDFEGSNDAGRTWRTYEVRDLPQREDRMAGMVAPRFPRFENTIFFESSRPGAQSVITAVATELLRGNRVIIDRFKQDPFPDRPPTLMRMRRYRLCLVDAETHRQTGNYWRKEFAGDYAPAFRRDEAGTIAPFDLSGPDTALKAGDLASAVAGYQRQFAEGNLEAGFRLAETHLRARPEPDSLVKAFALFSELSRRGEVKATHSVGLCLEHGVGVAADPAQAVNRYREAAERGYVPAMFALAAFRVKRPVPNLDDAAALGWALTTLERSKVPDPGYQPIRDALPALTQQLSSRLTGDQVAAARRFAAQRR
jgi:hypothetical protein